MGIFTIIGCISIYILIFWLARRFAEKNFTITLLFASILIFLLSAIFAIPLVINEDNDLAYKLDILWDGAFAPIGFLLFLLFLIISVFNIVRNKLSHKNLN